MQTSCGMSSHYKESTEVVFLDGLSEVRSLVMSLDDLDDVAQEHHVSAHDAQAVGLLEHQMLDLSVEVEDASLYHGLRSVTFAWSTSMAQTQSLRIQGRLQPSSGCNWWDWSWEHYLELRLDLL